MTERPSNRPGKAEAWPTMHRKLTMQLTPSDRIFFRSVNARGYPEGVGAGNLGETLHGDHRPQRNRRLGESQDLQGPRRV